MIRQVQDTRKEAGYRFNEKVLGQWHTEDWELKDAIEKWSEVIKDSTLLKDFKLTHQEGKENFDIQKEFEPAPQKKIWLGIRK